MPRPSEASWRAPFPSQVRWMTGGPTPDLAAKVLGTFGLAVRRTLVPLLEKPGGNLLTGRMAVAKDGVAVLGLGTMGQGIALVCSLSGFETRVFDVDPELAKSAHAAILAKLARIAEREKRPAEETQAIGDRIVVEPGVERACA